MSTPGDPDGGVLSHIEQIGVYELKDLRRDSEVLGDAIVTQYMRYGSADFFVSCACTHLYPIQASGGSVDGRGVTAVALPGGLHDLAERGVAFGRHL